MESKNDREREPLPESIFDDFGAIWDPQNRPKIDENLRVLPAQGVLGAIWYPLLGLEHFFNRF